MTASAKRKLAEPWGDLAALTRRSDICSEDIDTAAVRAANFFQKLAEDVTLPAPPDPSKFDPMTESYWELGMMLVSEMGGSVDHIRQVWSKYRRENYQRIYINGTIPTSNFEPQKPMSVLDLALCNAIWLSQGATLLKRPEAIERFWKRAEDQEIVGYGEPLSGAGTPVAIQPFHWPALTLGDDHTGLVLRFRESGYRHVRFANPCRDCKSTNDARLYANPQASSGRKRGPQPLQRDRVLTEMLADLGCGVYSPQQLNQEKEVTLSAKYKASRDTVRKARYAALAQWDAANSDK
jgi:hypothetical protein